MTNSFVGISPQSVANFLGGQIIGAVAASLFTHWLRGGKLATSPAPK